MKYTLHEFKITQARDAIGQELRMNEGEVVAGKGEVVEAAC
mgnify:CR=1 FL=1